MDSNSAAQLLDEKITNILYRELKKLGVLQGFLEAGKVISVNGDFADIFINGSPTATSNIPIQPGLTLIVNDEVWVMKVNFNQLDRFILCKRVV